MMEIDDHELEGSQGLDAGEGPAPEGVELASRHTQSLEMAIQGGARDLERLGAALAHQDVDDALGGSLVSLAFAAQADGPL
jgi:hypothetical protein